MALNSRRMLALLCVALVAGTAQGHHSTANYNFDAPARQTITGVVSYWSFSNPHSFIDVEVRAADGAVTPYKIFLTSRVVLQRYGWRPDSLKAGDEVEIEGSPDRVLSSELYLQRIRFPDGHEWRRDEVSE
jgi:Family of unknown function (DUF6152)